MTLKETYKRVRRSIVAIYESITTKDPEGKLPFYPRIIGTGFVVGPNGIVATNRHVIEEIMKTPHPSDPNRFAVMGSIFFFHEGIPGQIEFGMPLLGVIGIGSTHVEGHYYGDPRGPDIGFLHFDARGLPFLEYDPEYSLEEGEGVAVAGFPMGTEKFVNQGWLEHLTPTLNTGIISAIHPFPSPGAHGFSINALTQGGSSGSPVFLPHNGKVIGTLWGGLNDTLPHPNPDVAVTLAPAGQSLVVPAKLSAETLKLILQDERIQTPQSTKSFDQHIAEMLKNPEYDDTLGLSRWEPVKPPTDTGQAPPHPK